jgi:hypothetical protein
MNAMGVSVVTVGPGQHAHTIERAILRIARSMVWACWPGPTVTTETPIAFMSPKSAVMPRSLSHVNWVTRMCREPMVPNIRLTKEAMRSAIYSLPYLLPDAYDATSGSEFSEEVTSLPIIIYSNRQSLPL